MACSSGDRNLWILHNGLSLVFFHISKAQEELFLFSHFSFHISKAQDELFLCACPSDVYTYGMHTRHVSTEPLLSKGSYVLIFESSHFNSFITDANYFLCDINDMHIFYVNKK